MTEVQPIAVSQEGWSIFPAQRVAPGNHQPLGVLADGQPVWPVPEDGSRAPGEPRPFGLLSSGEPVWAEEVQALRPLYRKKRVLIPAALVVLVLIGSAGEEDPSGTQVASVDSAVTQDEVAAPEPAAPALTAEQAAADKAAADKAAADKAAADKAAADKAAADKAAADKAAADKAAEAANGTPSQQNAYDAAVDYLDYSAFSRTGLIEQLSSEYGSQFPAADAEWAVTRLEREGGVDWNAEAAEAAKDYLDFSSLSRQGLLDQLTSEYGSQFTPEHAEYGVNQTGL